MVLSIAKKLEAELGLKVVKLLEPRHYFMYTLLKKDKFKWTRQLWDDITISWFGSAFPVAQLFTVLRFTCMSTLVDTEGYFGCESTATVFALKNNNTLLQEL